MNRQSIFAAFLLAFSCSHLSEAQETTEASYRQVLRNADLSGLSNSQLIDRLRFITKKEEIAASWQIANDFIVWDLKPTPEEKATGKREPAIPPELRELVRRGVDALPNLIDHLSDDRTTEVTLPAVWLRERDWYPSRYSESDKQPKYLNTDLLAPTKEDFVVSVGDLCYVAIGQIVDRQLFVTHCGQPGYVGITSPVQTPGLAEAVRAEWGGLTEKAHRASLVEGARDSDWEVNLPALQRLTFYYPDAAEEVMLEHLAKTVYDNDHLWKFLFDDLLTQETAEDYQIAIQRFASQNGDEIASAIPFWLQHIYPLSLQDRRDAKGIKRRARIDHIFQTVYPAYNRQRRPPHNAIELDNLIPMLKSVRYLKSEKVDAAVHRLFLCQKHLEPDELEHLAERAFERVKATDKRKDYEDYFVAMIPKLQAHIAEDFPNKHYRGALKQQLIHYQRHLKMIRE